MPSPTSPLLLEPVLVPKPWGGDRLGRFGRDVAAGAMIGESWEVTDLAAEDTPVPEPVSRIRTGPAAGTTLSELLAADPRGLLGAASPSEGGRFPLLVKLLDARETLSVQVHPPASLSPAAFKTESWVVLDAEPGAELFVGVRHGVELPDVLDALGTSDIVPLLRPVPARAGDVVHVPAGTLHALGAGVLVAEVQTPSDVTHRVWDWPAQRDGGRELHVDEAAAAIEAGWEHNIAVEVARAHDGVLVDTDAYRLTRQTLQPGESLLFSTSSRVVHVAMVLAGGVGWTEPCDGTEHALDRAGVALLPAASTVPVVAGPDGASVLVATPS